VLLQLCIREETSAGSWKIWIEDKKMGVGYCWHPLLYL